jgi:hypothetical protein
MSASKLQLAAGNAVLTIWSCSLRAANSLCGPDTSTLVEATINARHKIQLNQAQELK